MCKKNTRKNPCVGRESDAPPAVKPSCSLSVDSHPPASRNRKPETDCSELETSRHESLFDRLRRKWAKIAPASKYSCDSEKFYEEYLKEKAAAGVPDTPPADQEPESAAPPPETANPQLELELEKLPSPRLPRPGNPLTPLRTPRNTTSPWNTAIASKTLPNTYPTAAGRKTSATPENSTAATENFLLLFFNRKLSFQKRPGPEASDHWSLLLAPYLLSAGEPAGEFAELQHPGPGGQGHQIVVEADMDQADLIFKGPVADRHGGLTVARFLEADAG